jgi:hypothetical protein
MKKIIVGCLGLFLGISTVSLFNSGCGSSNNSASPSPAPIPTATPVCSAGQIGVTSPSMAITQSDAANYLYAQAVTLSASTGVLSLNIYVGGTGTGQIRMGIYSDDSNYPGTLLYDGGVKTVISNAWNSFTVSGVWLPNVSSSTQYWIAHQFQNAAPVPNNNNAGGNWVTTNGALTFGSLPSNFPYESGTIGTTKQTLLQAVYLGSCQ